MADEPKRDFIFLLKFNNTDVKWIAENIEDDMQYWKGESFRCLPVTGEYDAVVLAENGTMLDALRFALRLTSTGRYTTTTLPAFQLQEFEVEAGACPVPDPHRKMAGAGKGV
jgi:uncharacterized protein with GYD domain